MILYKAVMGIGLWQSSMRRIAKFHPPLFTLAIAYCMMLDQKHSLGNFTVMTKIIFQCGYRIAQMLRLIWWRVAKPDIYGVKAVVLKDNQILLIRHSYANRHLYMLPGGGLGHNETVEAAISREVMEETGCHISNIRTHGQFCEASKGAKNHITIMVAYTQDTPICDGREIIEAAFFPVNNLPENIAKASFRRIKEIIENRPPAEHW